MPKMYRITEGASYSWVYVDAERVDGEPHPKDKELARSTRKPYTKEEMEQEIRDLKSAKVKWPGKPPQ